MRAHLKVASRGGPGASLNEDDGPQTAPGPSTPGGLGARPHLRVHAGLLRGVAYAPGLEKADFNR